MSLTLAESSVLVLHGLQTRVPTISIYMVSFFLSFDTALSFLANSSLGGAGFGENVTGFDDVYILTMPAFQWIQRYTADPPPGYPHNSLSCNVVDNAQMLIIGGTFPTSDMCDAPDVFGTHNLDLGKQNPKGAEWNLFNPNLTSYKVPSEIINVVGGA